MNFVMKLSDKILSLLKEKDYSFEELKEKTNSSFFELKDNIKNLLKEKKVFRKGFPTKYALHKSSEKVFLSKTITNSTRTLEDYKGVFLTTTILLLMVILYSVFLKNPFVYPGLEQRTFIVFLPSLLITILLYTPWQKIIRFIPINFVQEETLLFLDKAKHITSTKELKHFSKEFLEKILVPYYPHLLIILSVFSLFKIEFFSSFNEFFSPIALHLILISIGLITLKQKKPFFFKEKELCKYSFLLLLILVTLSSLSFEQITFLTEPLKVIQFQLTIITIILGAITFWQNKEVIEEIEEEQNTEEKEEQKRALEFGEKYPKLAKIPLVNKVTKWMYKEGWGYSFGLVLILIFGFFLRIYSLGKQSLWIDETYSYLAIEGITKTGLPIFQSGFLYYRELIFDYLVWFATQIFGLNEFGLRIIPAIIGVIAIIIVYKIMVKFFNRKISIIAATLFALMEWEIVYSRLLRFYIFNQFLYLITIYILLNIINKEKIKKKDILVLIFLFGALLSSSNLNIIFIILSTFWIISSQKIDLRNNKITKNKNFTLLLLTFSLSAVIYFIFIFDIGRTLNMMAPQLSFKNLIAFSTFIQKYLGFAIITGIVLILNKNLNENKNLKNLIYILFISGLIPVLLTPIFADRYIFSTLPILFIISLGLLLNIILKNKQKFTNFFLTAILVFLILTNSLILLPQETYYIDKINISQPDYAKAYALVYSQMDKHSTVITITGGGISPAKYYLKEKFSCKNNYNYFNTEDSSFDKYRDWVEKQKFLWMNYVDGKYTEIYTGCTIITDNASFNEIVGTIKNTFLIVEKKAYLDTRTKLQIKSCDQFLFEKLTVYSCK